MDHGKFIFEQRKKQQAAKKKRAGRRRKGARTTRKSPRKAAGRTRGRRSDRAADGDPERDGTRVVESSGSSEATATDRPARRGAGRLRTTRRTARR